jgi:Mg-chelatase subunit ChlD
MVSYGLTESLTVGVAHLWPVAILPVAVGILAYFILREGGERSAAPRSRRLLFASRVLLVVLLVLGAMGPYTIQTRETPGEPRVRMLVDESDSMAVSPNVTEELIADVESTGVPVTSATIGSGTDSLIGDGVAANLRENGTVVVVSDGQVTEGQRLRAVAETARSLNATVSVVETPPERSERAVSIDGPATASVGLETAFTVSVSGIDIDGPVPVEVTIDGETVEAGEIGQSETLSVTHSFEERGPHRVTATLEGQDIYDRNDVFYHTVRVVDKPEVLYVASGDYPLRGYLASLYNLTTVSSVPDSLDTYAAVVAQDKPAPQLGNVSALQEYVIGGGGLVVAGGENAYENGGYGESPLGSLLPVRVGNATGGTTNLVMVVDISGSTSEALSTQKAIALDVLDQVGDRNQVGLIAFDAQAYRVSEIRKLSDSRASIRNRIRRLETGRGTDIANALQGADRMLGDRQGTIILISDGWVSNRDRPVVVAKRLGRDGRRILPVGAAERVDETTMTRIAQAAGGSYYPADERSRLQLLFGGASRQIDGDNLTVVTPGTFITSGVEFSSTPGQANDVTVKGGADFQVATPDGTAAITSWRFGLGRVVSITSYAEDGSLGGLLSKPDSLAVTKSVNFAIGDPARASTGVTKVGDARAGQPATLTYRGQERPRAPNVTFQQVAEDSYRGEFTPDRPGYGTVLDATYAANYPHEYGQFGRSPALRSLLAATGGQTFAADEGADIARLARQQATRIRTVRDGWGWVALLLALGLFGVEVSLRRVEVYRGRTSLESGLR